MASDSFANISIKIGQKTQSVKIEKGVSFENNGAKYIVDNDGLLRKFDKKTNIWSQALSIEMNNYQYRAFSALADNDENEGLSKKDIDQAMSKYSNSELTADLEKELPTGYTVEKHSTGKTNKLKNGVEIGIAYQDSHQVSLKFTKATANEVKSAVNNSKKSQDVPLTGSTRTIVYENNPPAPKIYNQNLLKSSIFSSKYSNLEYIPPSQFTVTKQYGTLDAIRKIDGYDFFEMFAVNPDLNYKVQYDATELAKVDMVGFLQPGQVINIPARYKVKSGSVKNLDDVVKTTGVSKEYIEKVILALEPKIAGKPDLKAYYDNVNGKGALTIGFGHTGRFLDNRPLTEKTTITEAEAYEILAQDIIDNKVRTIAYLEQNGISKEKFDKLPLSLQSVIIDVAFNKGIYDGFENIFHDYTLAIKEDLSKNDIAAATMHTIRLSNAMGLEKRSAQRIIIAVQDLSLNDKKKVKAATNNEMQRIIERVRPKYPLDAAALENAWNKIA